MEVNKRINYPIKTVLVKMVQQGDLCMDDPLHQYCCSWLCLHVSNVGALLFVSSWNAHPIPGKCIQCHNYSQLITLHCIQEAGSVE